MKTEFIGWKKDKKNKNLIIGGALVCAGVIFGVRYQKFLTTKALQGVMTLKEAAEPMFPITMSIPEIKEALKLIDGAEFMDAIVVNIDGVQSLLVR